MNEEAFQDCYVAFLDILGFKELLKNDVFDQIYSIFKSIKEFKPRPIVDLPIYSDIRYHIMSDSIIVYVNALQKDSFMSLIDVCSQIQMYLLRQNEPILLRGGITRGSLYCKDDIIFGNGLSQAYLLEEELAIYPRIVFLEDTFNNASENTGFTELWKLTHHYYEKDDDGLLYVNFLDTLAIMPHIAEGNTEKTISLFIEIYDRIISFVEKALSTETHLSVRNKYIWLKNKLQLYVEHSEPLKKHFNEKEEERKAKVDKEINKILNEGVKND